MKTLDADMSHWNLPLHYVIAQQCPCLAKCCSMSLYHIVALTITTTSSSGVADQSQLSGCLVTSRHCWPVLLIRSLWKGLSAQWQSDRESFVCRGESLADYYTRTSWTEHTWSHHTLALAEVWTWPLNWNMNRAQAVIGGWILENIHTEFMCTCIRTYALRDESKAPQKPTEITTSQL